MGSRRVGVVVVSCVCVVVGCALITPLDDLDRGDASLFDASDASDASVEAGFCGALHGPAMIKVPSLAANETFYCIDSTEVTEAQYDEFVKAKVPTDAQAPFCLANTTFFPDLTQNNCGARPYNPTADPTMPVACVDWCDAYAYCKWAGKRLCGRLGAEAGAITDQLQQANSAGGDQWFNACSMGNARPYPYGAFDASACNGKPVDASADVAPVGSFPACVGGYAGIFDMSGNVAEWEDDCLDASADGAVACATRGGSVTENEGQLGCNQIQNLDWKTANYNYGIRCCADP
jgi:formylglycine-generating enzyme required for sulfatase activity